ncbi:MAG: endonuclease domain-containing protein, partial [Tepidiformaceae bacterium]
RQLDGWKFRRQHPVGRFVLDFYCGEAQVAVEIDGPVHDDTVARAADAERQSILEGHGIRFVRVRTEEVKNSLESVLEQIAAFCRESHDDLGSPPA